MTCFADALKTAKEVARVAESVGKLMRGLDDTKAGEYSDALRAVAGSRPRPAESFDRAVALAKLLDETGDRPPVTGLSTTAGGGRESGGGARPALVQY